MKKLLLASSGRFITEKAINIFHRPLNEMNLLYINTASKKVNDLEYIEYRRKRMKELEFNYTEVDIKGKSKEELEKLLKDKEAVFVEGGNTFYLLKSIRESGFDSLIKEKVEEGLIYIGSSAGSYVCSPTIEMATWKDDKMDRCDLTDLKAMNLVPFIIFAHYSSQYKELIEEKSENIKYPIKTLTDNQAFLVNGEEIERIETNGLIKGD